MPPALVEYSTPGEYEEHYRRNYCQVAIFTHDHIRVFFPRGQFQHAFYESVNRRQADKSQFAIERARRIDWIAAALADGSVTRLAGWDKRRKGYDHGHCVTLIWLNYVVVIRIGKHRTATFVTAFPCEGPTLSKIGTSPPWDEALCGW